MLGEANRSRNRVGLTHLKVAHSALRRIAVDVSNDAGSLVLPEVFVCSPCVPHGRSLLKPVSTPRMLLHQSKQENVLVMTCAAGRSISNTNLA